MEDPGASKEERRDRLAAMVATGLEEQFVWASAVAWWTNLNVVVAVVKSTCSSATEVHPKKMKT